MKNFVFILFLFATNLYSQQSHSILEDTLPKPSVKFKDWDKKIMPVKHFENGSEFVATCDNGVDCKVISYRMVVVKDGFYKNLYVNSNKFDGEALAYFKNLENNTHIYFVDFRVQYSDYILRKSHELNFLKVKDEFDHFTKSALDDNPLIEDFGVFKTDIRIKIDGTPTKEDTRIVEELVNELNLLLDNHSIKLVDKSPAIVLDFQKSDFDGVWSVNDTILNPLFPKVKQKFINLKINSDIQEYRKAIITIAIIRNLAEFRNSNNDWRETAIIGWNHEEHPVQLTEYDKTLIKMLYSSKGQKELKSTLSIPSVKLADNTLLILILSFLLFLAFSELNSKYHFLDVIQFNKNKLIRSIIYSLLIVQIPILLTLIFNQPDTGNIFKLFISYELNFCLLAIVLTLLLGIIGNISHLIRNSGFGLFIEIVLVILSFIISYQLIYLLEKPELLNVSLINIQWLIIPLSVVAYRFYIAQSQKRISGILREKELELARQKELSLKSELLALQSRINPHFLYNALNSIASLVNIDAGKTEKMTLALAKLFRYNINKGNETFSTVQDEIENVKIYLDVEMIRFSERMKYSIDVERELNNCQIPVFILQPLVENAIKHGISNMSENGEIQIKIYSDDTWVVLSVYDNGPEFPKEIMTNYGLQSVFDKLSLLYKNNYEAKFINSPEKHIRIKIKR